MHILSVSLYCYYTIVTIQNKCLIKLVKKKKARTFLGP